MLLLAARARGTCVFVATHDPDVIERFERGLMLANGEVVHDGPAADLHDLLSPDDRHGGR